MRAAILTEYRKIVVGTRPDPVPGPNQLIVKVMAAGLCPTDHRLFTGAATFKKPPTILGHEPAGEVVQTGPGVKKFRVGDKVAGDTSLRCGRCAPCLNGRENLCTARKQVGDGTLAEYVLVNEEYVNRFEKVTFAEASLTEPLACVLNSISNSSIGSNDTVAIVGSGQIGLLHLLVSKFLGARTIVLDLRRDRLEVAEGLGADHVIDTSKDDPKSSVMSLTGGRGADKVIVAIGNVAAAEAGLSMVAKSGSVNLFGSSPPGTRLSVDPNQVHHDEISLIGSFDKTRRDLRLAIRFIDSGKVDVKPLISHRFSLEDTQQAFELLGASGGVKIIVEPARS